MTGPSDGLNRENIKRVRDLEDLLARVEAATGKGKALDRAIAAQFGWFRVEPRFTGRRSGGWIAPEDFLGADAQGRPALDQMRGTEIHGEVPDFTASIDAALGLVERALPGAVWRIGHRYGDSCYHFLATVMPDVGGADADGTGPTAPLAILAALLKAKIAEGQP